MNITTNKLIWAIKILKEHNPLRNDIDAYLYAVCEYALGELGEKPSHKEYGLGPK